jgi:uncharacterized repeat protein (TIGR01451 family)
MNISRLAAPIICSVLIALAGTSAVAKPTVALKLVGVILEKNASGTITPVPVESTPAKPGESIRYTITAVNTSGEVAKKFASAGRIPSGTQYEPGSSTIAAPGHIEFSLDGGKTWAEKPMVRVRQPDGSMAIKPADPATYTNIRWLSGKDLPAHAAIAYTYAVLVK